VYRLHASQRYRKVLIPILAIAIPLCITLLVIEVGLRLSGFRSPVIHAEMFRTTDDPLLPYTLRGGYSGDFAGGAVKVGLDGNRIVPLPPNADKNTFSHDIVLLGDSVAFGQGVDDEETIAASLQRAFYGRKPIRVVSIAAPGYTSWNEYAALLHYPNLANVKTVVLLYVSNDITEDNDHFKLRDNGQLIYYLENDPFHRFIRALHNKSRLSSLLVYSFKKFKYKLESEQTGTAEEIDSDALSYSIAAIKNIKYLCSKRNINLIVAVYRDGVVYRQPNWVAAYERAVLSRLEAIDVPHFVLDSPTDRLSKDAFGVSWNDYSHPNFEASRIIAEQIAAELNKSGFD
jgi:hypothetical protein